MKIYGLQKLTLLDFPQRVACTVFTGGCNLRCPFCHNASLVRLEDEQDLTEEAVAFIQKRARMLQGVCVTGGEPLLQPDLADFLRFVRSLGLATKLDTNGTLPDRLSPLLAEGLLDYVAMDLKNSPDRYAETVGLPRFDFAPVAETMRLLRTSGIDYEYRTTVVKGLHSAEGLKGVAALLTRDEKWFLQQFTDSGNLLSEGLEGFSPAEMQLLYDGLLPLVPQLQLRGL